MPTDLNRRKFLGSGLATAGLTVAAAAVGTASAEAAEPLRAAVLEFKDPWTNGVGLAQLLTKAGVTVVPLDPAKSATEQGVDLIAFGTFTNNAPTYGEYISSQAASIRDFVAGGGVVLDLAQSDQFNATVDYLAPPLAAKRADPDHDAIFVVAPEHPLVKDLRTANAGQVFTDRSASIRVSWESLVSWESMRVLLSATPGAFPEPPILLEGAHGKGRFLVTSLTVDKCYDAAGASIQPAVAVQDSEAFFAGVAAYVASVKAGTAPAVVPTPKPKDRATGPMVGHTTTKTTRIWLRPGKDDQKVTSWRCTVTGAHGAKITASATLSDANDHSMIFEVGGLRAATRYTFSIVPTSGADGFTPLTGSFQHRTV
ncbi:hypothetical protein [Luteipulveratus mongoliensis]|uniref:Fibronectin type-III domain-containing protein n=1 Tax=Luteipulveratus mongoliensis TaxID=571913 RepID=A0A0K1JM43_9MICO|nr:hypothetical protein [Luteipulveratus mongoliensis]AKU17779.1 hypothetical protein VV02_21180 [Luteipulveratus mongoliensis]